MTALKQGRLVIVPTDTVYGVAADPTVPGAEKRICAAKGRDANKPIPLLAAGIADIEAYGAVLGPAEKRIAARFWPGPLTLVLRVGRGDEGFRVPDCAVTLELLRRCGILRVTSANLSGAPPALTVHEAVDMLEEYVDVALDAGPAPGGVPSTVARIEHGTPVILREGAISKTQLEKECRNR